MAQRRSILKPNEDDPSTEQCTCPEKIRSKFIRNPYRRLRDPSELTQPTGRHAVTFGTHVESTLSTRRKSSQASGMPRAPSSNGILSAMKNARQHSAHIHSITMYVDDHQKPGQTTKLTLAYSSSKLSNPETLSEDILRFAKSKGRHIKSATKEVESRLSTHHRKSAERLRLRENHEKLLKEKEEDIRVTQNIQPTVPVTQTDGLLTSGEMNDFRKRRITKKSSGLPGYASAQERKKCAYAS